MVLNVANLLLYTRELQGIWVQVSGGVNELIRNRADFLEIKIHGTGVGIFSLEVVRDLIKQEGFLDNPSALQQALQQAISHAQNLVKACRGKVVDKNAFAHIRSQSRRWGSSFHEITSDCQIN